MGQRGSTQCMVGGGIYFKNDRSPPRKHHSFFPLLEQVRNCTPYEMGDQLSGTPAPHAKTHNCVDTFKPCRARVFPRKKEAIPKPTSTDLGLSGRRRRHHGALRVEQGWERRAPGQPAGHTSALRALATSTESGRPDRSVP